MKNNRNKIYSIIEDKLQEGMYQGNMHKCLLSVGRTAGGYVSSGLLYDSDILSLGNYAKSLAINSAEAERKWDEAVEYGKREPLEFDSDYESHPQREDRALEWDDVIGGEWE